MRETTAQKVPMHLRHGDTVKIMTGREKGKTGRILTVNPAKQQVTIEHANIIKRHTRPNPSKNIKGGILDKEGPLHVSNVMLVCPGCGKHTRVGHTRLPDGSKTRVCRRCGVTLES